MASCSVQCKQPVHLGTSCSRTLERGKQQGLLKAELSLGSQLEGAADDENVWIVWCLLQNGGNRAGWVGYLHRCEVYILSEPENSGSTLAMAVVCVSGGGGWGGEGGMWLTDCSVSNIVTAVATCVEFTAGQRSHVATADKGEGGFVSAQHTCFLPHSPWYHRLPSMSWSLYQP